MPSSRPPGDERPPRGKTNPHLLLLHGQLEALALGSTSPRVHHQLEQELRATLSAVHRFEPQTSSLNIHRVFKQVIDRMMDVPRGKKRDVQPLRDIANRKLLFLARGLTHLGDPLLVETQKYLLHTGPEEVRDEAMSGLLRFRQPEIGNLNRIKLLLQRTSNVDAVRRGLWYVEARALGDPQLKAKDVARRAPDRKVMTPGRSGPRANPSHAFLDEMELLKHHPQYMFFKDQYNDVIRAMNHPRINAFLYAQSVRHVHPPSRN